MIDYLNTPHYYSEHLADVEDTEELETNRLEENPSRSVQTDGGRSNYVLMQNGADNLRQS